MVVAAANKDVFFVMYDGGLAYLLFWLAYVPGGVIRKFNRLGDYSYGVYIYAFPVQQSLVALVPAMTVAALQPAALAATMSLAALSWHCIESKALTLKSGSVGQLRRLRVKFNIFASDPQPAGPAA